MAKVLLRDIKRDDRLIEFKAKNVPHTEIAKRFKVTPQMISHLVKRLRKEGRIT